MNDFTLRISTTPREALDDPHSIIWLKGTEWDDVDDIPPEFANRTAIFTSAWQMGVLRASGMGSANHGYYIVPEGTPDVRYRVPEYDGRVDIVWRGSDPGSAILTAAVANAAKLDENNCSIKFFGEPSPMLMQTMKRGRDEVITDFTEEMFEDALSDSHVFMYPSFRYHSQHIPTVKAAKAGCICVVPNHSGFREILGPFGAYIHHSMDNIEYATSAAEKLMNCIGALQSSWESTGTALNAQASFANLSFSKKYEEHWLASVRSNLESLHNQEKFLSQGIQTRH